MTAPIIRVSPSLIFIARLIVHMISLGLLANIYYQAILGHIDGDPVQALINFSGIGTLNLLVLTLLISPLAQYLRFAQLMALRKTFGVYAAVYALFHFYVFVAYELAFEWQLVVEEIIDRPYITVGFTALLLLLMMLFTSVNRVRKRMGKRWQQLHNSIYLVAILGCLHFLWSVKSNVTEPLIYAIIFLLLLFIPSLRRHRLKRIIIR